MTFPAVRMALLKSHFAFGFLLVALVSLRLTSGALDGPPFINCPVDIIQPTDINLSYATICINLTASDSVNCIDQTGRDLEAEFTFATSRRKRGSPGNSFTYGNHTVYCNATNDEGYNTCNFTVTVTDEQPPVITCPRNIEQPTDFGEARVSLPVSVMDNVQHGSVQCMDQDGMTINAEVTIIPPMAPSRRRRTSSFHIFTYGLHSIYCVTSDHLGYTANCTFTVNITDGDPPRIECPGDISQPTDGNTENADVEIIVNSTDNIGVVGLSCSDQDGMTVLNVVSTTPPPPTTTIPPSRRRRSPVLTSFFYGNNTVTCEAMDAAGLTDSCNFTINIIDDDPPMIFCPSNMTKYADSVSGTAQAFIDVIAVEVLQPTGTTLICLAADGSIVHTNMNNTFKSGMTNVNCVATDRVGNSAACFFLVDVLDDDAPVPECPSEVVQETMPRSNSSTVIWSINVTDNTDQSPSMMCNYQSGDIFYFGNTTVMCNFSDASKNFASCMFNVMIEDGEMPVHACPVNLMLPTSTGTNSTTVPLPDVTDNVDTNPSVTCAFPDGTLFEVGRHNMACTFEDASGNIETCSYTVIVIDQERPVLSCPLSPPTEEIPIGQSSVAVTYSVTATDNVDSSPDIVCNPASGSQFSGSQTNTTCVSTDQAGNNGTCLFVVIVSDIEAPTVSCPQNVTLPTASGTNSQTTMYVATSTDLVDASPSVVCLPASGSSFMVGDTLVTCTATDASQNVNDCSFNVLIEDHERPTLQCIAPDVTADINASGAAVVLDITAEDNVDSSPTISCTPASGTVLDVNIRTDYTCQATDTAGNTQSCDFQVTVQEPTVSCAPPRVSFRGRCFYSRRLATTIIIVAIDGIGAFPTAALRQMDGAEFDTFRRQIIVLVLQIAGVSDNRGRVSIIAIRSGSIVVDMNIDVFGDTPAEAETMFASVSNSSFSNFQNPVVVPSGGNLFRLTAFQNAVPPSCDNYCMHGGTCFVTASSSRTCTCPLSTTGERCENVVSSQSPLGDAAIIGIIVGITGLLIIFFMILCGCVLLMRQRNLVMRQKEPMSRNIMLMNPRSSRRLAMEQDSRLNHLNKEFSLPYIPPDGPNGVYDDYRRGSPRLIFN